MRLVRQKEPMGCGIACVAMAAGTTYDEVRALLGDWWSGREGMTHYVIFEMLSHMGYACINLFRTNQLNYNPREPWPPEPVSECHIVHLSLPTGGHWVVWLRDGTVLDPAKSGRHTLDDYPEPHQIIGVVPTMRVK